MKRLFEWWNEVVESDASLQTLYRGTGVSGAIRVVSFGLAFGVQVALARMLGAEEYGDYVYVLNWVLLAGILGKGGFDSAAVRFMAEYNASEDWRAFRGLSRRSIQIPLLASLLLAAILVVLGWLFGERREEGLFLVFVAGAILLPLQVLLEIRASSLRGLKKIARALVPTDILKPLLLVGMVAIARFIWPGTGDAALTMGIGAGSAAVALAVSDFLFRGTVPSAVKRAEASFRTRTWVRVSLPLLLISSLLLVINRADTLMLGAMVGTTQAGIYATASRVATFVSFGLTSANVIVAPLISELYTEGRGEKLNRIVGRVILFSLGAGLLVSIGLVTVGEFVLGIFGPEFVSGFTPLLVLLVAQLLLVATGPVGYLMTMTDHEDAAAVILGTGAILNLILNYLLIPEYGMLGAALATSTSIATWNLLMFGYMWHELGVRPQFR